MDQTTDVRLEAGMLSWDDVDIGELIGSGSTSCVYLVRVKSPTLRVESAYDGIEDTSWIYSAKGVNERHETKCDRRKLYCSERSDSTKSTHSESSSIATPRRFALKRLSAATLSSSDETKAASEGMKFEANLLMNLLPPHPNIVRLVGISDDLFTSPDQSFTVLECLVETLQDRITNWKCRQVAYKNRMTCWQQCQSMFDPSASESEQRFRIRQAGLGIAKALKFLHQNKILYRDLKPTNVGFDNLGQVRLFDFGHSRLHCHDDADRNLTMGVGSLRYMSPECASGRRYDFSSDVHSFAILLWEICTVERPFSRVRDALQLSKHVFSGKRRPPLRSIASPDIRQLLRTCWDPDPNLRLSFSSVVDFLHVSLTPRKQPKR